MAGRPDAMHRNLCPTAGGSAQINDTCTGPQQSVLLVELREFVGGPASVPRGLGFGHIGIVDLSRQPSSGRSASSFVRLDHRTLRPAAVDPGLGFAARLVTRQWQHRRLRQ